jgi:hypothetical protein
VVAAAVDLTEISKEAAEGVEIEMEEEEEEAADEAVEAHAEEAVDVAEAKDHQILKEVLM